MRDIKFRGCDIQDIWRHGSVLIDEVPIIGTQYIIVQDRIQYVLPDNSTIGQFTGLTDKNGKEIYEGDILEYDTGKRYVVVYSIEAFDSGTNEHYIGAYMLRDDHNFHELICNVTRPYKYAEIIGNIHDHTELLTK